jgi:type II secretory pathway pseudopilin PulG
MLMFVVIILSFLMTLAMLVLKAVIGDREKESSGLSSMDGSPHR